jgi:uncharacterized cupredoxin-like copper-binding protein
MTRKLLVLFATVVALASVSCGSDNGDGSSGSGTAGGDSEGSVSATEKDFAIGLDPSSANDGSVSFDIQNQGTATPEFVLFKTDLAADGLPTTKDENGATIVDENGKGLDLVDEAEDIASGASATLTVNLDAGSYVAICNLPGHYQQGMRAELTVS